MDNPMSGSEYEYAKVCKSKTEITVSDGYSAGTDRLSAWNLHAGDIGCVEGTWDYRGT